MNKHISNNQLSLGQSDLHVTVLSEIDGYSYFQSLYSYEEEPYDLDLLEKKILGDGQLNEKTAVALIALVNVRRIYQFSDHSLGIQCSDTPGFDGCMQQCETLRSSMLSSAYKDLLINTGISILAGAVSGGGMIFGFVATMANSVRAQISIRDFYQECTSSCSRNFPCQ